jgi:hypothetical protein
VEEKRGDLLFRDHLPAIAGLERDPRMSIISNDPIREGLDLPPWADSGEVREPVVMTEKGPVPFSLVPQLIKDKLRQRPEDQQPPVPNENGSIHSLVIRDVERRRDLGVSRYGTPLQAHNGRDALRDAYEEALDLACYLRQAIEERDNLPSRRCCFSLSARFTALRFTDSPETH